MRSLQSFELWKRNLLKRVFYVAEWLVRLNSARVGVDNTDAAVRLTSCAVLQQSQQCTFLLEISTTADYGCLEILCLRAWDQPWGAQRCLGTVQTVVSIGLNRKDAVSKLLSFSPVVQQSKMFVVLVKRLLWSQGNLFGEMHQRAYVIISFTESRVVLKTDRLWTSSEGLFRLG